MHTSREIAQAMVDRAFAQARRYPHPVPLPAVECPECLGTGGGEAIVGGWTVPRTKLVECPECRGTGEIRRICIICGALATTEFFGGQMRMCDRHATDTRDLDGEDLAVAFALRVLP